MQTKFRLKILKVGNHLGDTGVGGRMVLRRTLGKYDGRLKSSCTDLITPSRNFVEVR
jgi:hypothetical protein